MSYPTLRLIIVWIIAAISPVIAAPTTFPDDVYFGSGRPWVDVRAFGAVGDGVTNDSAAFASAIAAITGTPHFGGTVYVPSGSYCLNSGVTLSSSGSHYQIVGETWLNTILSACGHDVPVLTIDHGRHVVSTLNVVGYNSVGPSITSSAIVIGSTCVDCKLSRVFAYGGYYTILNQGHDTVVENVNASQAYGPAVFENVGGALWMRRAKIDQSWPVSLPAAGTTFGTWTASYAYSVGDVVAVGSYYVQSRVAGTSGSSAPTVVQYGVDISDGSGTLKWQLAAPTFYYGLRIDGGASETHVEQSDFTGSYSTASIGINKQNGGDVPWNTVISDSAASQSYGPAIAGTAGVGLILKGNELAGCIQSVCGSVALSSAWQGDAIISNNIIWNGSVGIYVASGVNTTISNNVIGAGTAGIIMDANVSYFHISGTVPSAKFGGNNNILISTGTSNYYYIAGNIGATVVDGGTGTNKTTTPNN
jgi:hypothetical protein